MLFIILQRKTIQIIRKVMKAKNIFVVAMMAIMPPSVNASADSIQIQFQTCIVNPTSRIDKQTRTPVQPPHIYIDNYTLYFNTPCDGCELRIVDCTDEVVYSIMIPDNTQRIELPDYLLGTYQLQIIRGNFCFHGDIEL